MSRGISLISVAAGMAILGIGVYIMMSTGALLSFSGGRIDRSIRGQQVLVGVASDLQKLEFNQIITLCGGKASLGSEITGDCTDGETLKALANQTQPAAGNPLINVQINENGKIQESGGNCVELKKCSLTGGGNLLELTLVAYWKDANTKQGLISKPMVLRRVRW